MRRPPLALALALAALLATAMPSLAAPALDVFFYITLVEDDNAGHRTELRRAMLDPDGSLLIQWDEDALRAAMTDSVAAPAEATLSSSRRLATLRELVGSFLEAQAALVEARSLGPATASAKARVANASFASVAGAALTAATEHEDALRSAGAAGEADAFRAALNRAVLEDYAALADAMTAEIDALRSRVSEALASAPGRRVRMRATLVGALESRRIHLDGYDTLDTYDPHETPRFQFELDERARQEVEAAQALGDVVRDAMSGELRRKIDEAVEALRQELDALAQSLRTDVLEGNVREALEAMRASGDARFGPAIKAGRTLLGTLDALTLTVPPFEAEDDAQMLLRIYDALGSQLAGVAAQIRGLTAQLAGFVGDVESIAGEVPGAIAGDTRAALRRSLQDVRDDPRIQAVAQAFDDVRRSLGLTAGVAGSALAAAGDVPRALDQDLDTRIDLLIATPGRRYHGDVLIVEATVLEGEGDAERVVGRGFRKLRLVRLGPRGELRGALIFADPSDDAFADQDWEPTPALGYMLNFGTRSRVWNDVLDPGVGVAMTIMDWQEEDDFELGIAANVSLFRGLLWVGYGRNIQAESDFFHVGINPLVIGRLTRKGWAGSSAGGGGF